MLVNLADTPENRAMLGAILGSTRAGEQALLRRLARGRPDLFAGRVVCFDRNFPGHELITAILDAGGHVVARVSATVALPLEPGGGWLPDGSRMTWLNAPSGKKADWLPVRAAEHNAVLPCGGGQEVSETCTVITTLLDHEAAPAEAVWETYLTRWSASETTFGEDKATVTGAGNRHRETAGHRVRLWVLITTAATRTRQEGGTAPPARAADRGTARHPRRDTRANHALTPATPSQKRTQEQTLNTKLEKPPNTTNT
jgi:hypothetical protein